MNAVSRSLLGLLTGLNLSLCLSLLMSAPALGQSFASAHVNAGVIAEAAEFRDSALEGTEAFHWVERLTTEVGPRLAGSAGEARARDWAVSALTELGFDNVHIEPFEIDGWERGQEFGHVVAPFPQPLMLTALGGSVATPAEGLEADVEVFASLAALKRAPKGSLTGKIAYVGHAMRATQDGSHYGYFGALRREGASIAASKGAVGLLIRSIGTDSHRMPHTGSMRYQDDQPKIPAAALSNPDADQIERIARRNQTIRVAMTLTPTFTGKVPSGNVIADITGSDFPDQYVVIGGHLDAWDLATGAIDDGAGVAITLETARRILVSGKRPKRTIRLILWGAEEVGLLGGYAYLKAHDNSLRNHVAGTESDFGAGRIWRITSRVSVQAKPLIDLIAELVEPLGIAPGPNTIAGSGPDLTPMVNAGMPSFRFVQDGSDYFDLHHTPDDTLDKIEPAAMDQNVAAFLVFSWLAANSDLTDWVGCHHRNDGNQRIFWVAHRKRPTS